jgi:hypothetical protein
VVYERPSYSNLGNFDSDLVRRTLDWHREEFPGEDFGSQHQLRVALWRLYNNLFRGLPKVVLTGNGAVLCHAGPTDTGPFAYIGDPKVASSPPSFQEAVAWLAGAQFIDPTLHDDNIEEAQLLLESHLTWSDCTLDHSRIQQNLKRRSGLLVGPDALQSFLDILGRQVLIRGHQKNPPPGATRLDRHAWTAGHQVITINSVLENGDFIETDSQSMQLRSRQHLELDLSRQIRSVDDISLKKL